MQKETLKTAIEKYYLNGLTESTKIVVKDKTVVINFIPNEDKSLIGKIVINNTDLTDAEIGVYNTSQLLKLIKILDHTLKLTFNQEYGVFDKMLLQDNKYDLEFYLADINMIGRIPKVKEPGQYGLEMKLDTEFIKKFTNAKKALGDIKRFTVEANVLGENQITFILGDGSSYANRVRFNVPINNSSRIDTIPFSANILYEVLIANSNATSGDLYLSEEGLLKLSFKEGEIESTYFLVRLEE